MNKIKSYINNYLTENPYFNISFCVWIFIVITLPFTTFFMWPAAIVLLLSLLFENSWKQKIYNFKENLGVPYGLFLIFIYLIPIIGFFYSKDTDVALAEFECYMWFPLAPIFLLTISNKELSLKHLTLLIKIFAICVCINIFILFSIGIARTIYFHDTLYLYYSHFSIFRHPTYSTLYTTFTFFLILNYLYKYNNTSRKKYICLYIIEFFIALSIFCIYSRAGILIFFLLLGIWGGYILYTYPKRWKKIVVMFAVIISTFSLLMVTDIMPVNRFAKTKYSVDEKDTADSEKSEARVAIWKTAWSGISENMPFGVGTGDAFDVIKEKSIEKGYSNITKKHYNAHNQYLQAMLTNGIPGIVVLLLYASVPLILSIKFRNIHLLTIFILLSLNCLCECMFEIRSGVDFFAVMIPIFMLRGKLQVKK